MGETNERVTVQAEVTFELPADLELRRRIYGTTDPLECARVDVDVDAGAFFMDALDLKLLKVKP